MNVSLSGRNIEFSSDSKTAASWVNCLDGIGSFNHVNFIYDIRNILQLNPGFVVKFSSRSTNSFADDLAKQGSADSLDRIVWGYLLVIGPQMGPLTLSADVKTTSAAPSGSAFVVRDYKQRISRWGALNPVQNTVSKMCETHCRPHGIETLPKGIISRTSDLEIRSLSGPENKKKSKKSMNLLAIAAGIKQKESVNKIVKKFPPSDFVVMLFHYDGIVEAWNDFEWSAHAIHVSVMNQTKWWFAKRFLHPDIILDYAYIFLWDEDLGVDNFHAGRYLSIIKKEGLEISQPALDPDKSELHHYLTARDTRSRVHRRIYKKIGRRKCDENSTNPPCTGFVEMMAPVFSRASWRCTWHMIQVRSVLTFQALSSINSLACRDLWIADARNKASALFVGVYEPMKQKLLTMFPENLSVVAHTGAAPN
ncbi:hypothetical protein Q3G72_020029 [Acer saccharum]|nr:hypothetical protein Q3G72_020029 [Acer saccharum]